MDRPDPGRPAPELELETLLQQLLETQIALGDDLTATSQFLRFVLSLANENLGAIKTQLEKIRDLAVEIDGIDCA